MKKLNMKMKNPIKEWKKWNKKKKIISATISLVLVCVLVVTLIFNGRKNDRIMPQTSASETTVTLGNISNTIVGTGNLEIDDSNSIKIPEDITIKKVNVESGDAVSKGDILATVDKASVLEVMEEIEDELDDLDAQINAGSDDEETVTVKATVSGKVKKVYAKKGSTVSELLSKKGALIVIAVDGDSDNLVEVVAAEGTVSEVSVSKNDTVSKGDKLLVIETNGESTAYKKLLEERKNLVALYAKMSVIAQNGSIVADMDGIIGTVNISAESSVNSSNVNGISASKMSTSGNIKVTAKQDVVSNNAITLTKTANTENTNTVGGSDNTENTNTAGNSDNTENTNTSDNNEGNSDATNSDIGDSNAEGSSTTNSNDSNNNSENQKDNIPNDNKTSNNKTNSDNINTPSNLNGNNNVLANTANDSKENTYSETTGQSSTSNGSSLNTKTSSESTASSETNDISITEITAFTIASNDNMILSVNVDELDINSVNINQEATITMDAIEDKTFTGKVTRVSNTASSAGSGVAKYTVEITVEKDEQMKSGMNASVTIVIENKENILTLPVTAIQEKGNQSFVYTSKDSDGNLSGEVAVTTGLSDGDNVEITEGLTEGDVVYYLKTGNMSGGNGMDAMFGGEMDERNHDGMDSMKGFGERGNSGNMPEMPQGMPGGN